MSGEIAVTHAPPLPFGAYIVFVDESGDHGMGVNIDPDYPMFVLAFCAFRKADYLAQVCPAVQSLKFKHWGHDAVILHEHEIRKPTGHYAFLLARDRREAFMSDLNALMQQAPFTLIAAAIRKIDFARHYATPVNPYSIALAFGLERLYRHLESLGQAGVLTHVVLEQRGKREDAELELEFRRVCGGDNYLQKPLPFAMVLAPKQSNAPGMQIADLVARPIGIKTLRPEKPNRAYDILEPKFRRNPQGEIRGWGLKTFP
jgi:hypothetical protein